MDDLATASLSNEEYILDVPFTLEEVAYAVNKLKSCKACVIILVAVVDATRATM